MSLRRYTRAVPFNYTSYGIYRLGLTSGIIPATPLANAEVLQFRWNPSNRNILAAIHRIRFSIATSTTQFAAGVPVSLTLTRASAWSAAGTGGSSPTIAATCKLDSNMASSALAAGDCRITGTDATGLGAGTKTLEANLLGHAVIGQKITAELDQHMAGPVDLFDANVDGAGHPIVLRAGAAAANAEGIAVRATAPATGTWRISFDIEWAETTSYPYGSSA